MGKKEQLLSDLKNREVKAYEELFFKYHGRLVLFALKFTDDLQAAKDIVQDTFLSLWEKADKINVSLKAYLFQSVKNSSLNHLRHLKIDPTVKDEAAYKISVAERMEYFDFNDPYYSLLELEMEQKIEKAINSLPTKCLIVFNHSRKEHLKNKEIAEKLGVSVKTVEKHISKALSVIRLELSEYIGEYIGLLLLILLKNQ
jgi:RNA polymerase sigma-70 factor (ECF subfamily)